MSILASPDLDATAHAAQRLLDRHNTPTPDPDDAGRVAGFLRQLVKKHTTTTDAGTEPAAEARRPWWQTTACPTWCFNPHQGDDLYEDRTHYGPRGENTPTVPLSLHPPVWHTIKDGQRVYGPTTVTVDLEQHVDSVTPIVKIADGSTGMPLLRMTPAETVQLLDGLAAVVAMTRGGAR